MQLYCGIEGSLGNLGHGCTARDQGCTATQKLELNLHHACFPPPKTAYDPGNSLARLAQAGYRPSWDPGRETLNVRTAESADTEEKRRIVDDSHTVMVMGVSIN